MQETLTFATTRGLHHITSDIADVIRDSGVKTGLVNLFCQHTSASLIITENTDPDVLKDLETWMNKAVPENAKYNHADEGSDDMPAHIKAVLTQSSISIPIVSGKMGLGTWQGIFLWEHRDGEHERKIVVTIQ
jgi:secondary thiamine-phosphate synthase enzyme